ncbi:hypothetical protein Droror1_Dr00025915 [Drosera rotundifolia]
MLEPVPFQGTGRELHPSPNKSSRRSESTSLTPSSRNKRSAKPDSKHRTIPKYLRYSQPPTLFRRTRLTNQQQLTLSSTQRTNSTNPTPKSKPKPKPNNPDLIRPDPSFDSLQITPNLPRTKFLTIPTRSISQTS